MDKNRYLYHFYSLSGIALGIYGTIYASLELDYDFNRFFASEKIETVNVLFTNIDKGNLFYGLFLNLLGIGLLIAAGHFKFKGENENEKRNT